MNLQHPGAIKSFDSLEELIEARICCMYARLRPPMKQLVIEVLKQGKHVIVEKPFTGYFGDGITRI